MTIVIVAIFCGCMAVAIVSDELLGPHNVIEVEAEYLAEEEAETLLGLPDGALKEDIDELVSYAQKV